MLPHKLKPRGPILRSAVAQGAKVLIYSSHVKLHLRHPVRRSRCAPPPALLAYRWYSYQLFTITHQFMGVCLTGDSIANQIVRTHWPSFIKQAYAIKEVYTDRTPISMQSSAFISLDVSACVHSNLTPSLISCMQVSISMDLQCSIVKMIIR